MRRFLTRRWLLWHALMIILVTAFCVLGWWQWQRGESGNLRSFGYAFEWPAFAVFVIVFWIRMMRDELRPPAPDPREDADEQRAAEFAQQRAEVARPTAAAEEDDPELAAYNAYLARLHGGR